MTKDLPNQMRKPIVFALWAALIFGWSLGWMSQYFIKDVLHSKDWTVGETKLTVMDDSKTIAGKEYLTIDRTGTTVDTITIDLKGLCEARKQ